MNNFKDNTDSNSNLPLVEGVLRGIEIVIPRCPLCGLAHYYGSVAPGHYQIGDFTARVPHCPSFLTGGFRAKPLPHKYPNYIIKIVGDVGLTGKIHGLSRKRKPRADLPPPKMIDTSQLLIK